MASAAAGGGRGVASLSVAAALDAQRARETDLPSQPRGHVAKLVSLLAYSVVTSFLWAKAQVPECVAAAGAVRCPWQVANRQTCPNA